MSVQGKHRKPRLATVARIAIAAGVAGAAIGLPVTAASAHTATEQGANRPASQVSTDATPVASAHDYRVVSGDTLSKIAAAQHVDGGWEKLYQDNHSVVGGNPDLIFPGQQLTINGQAAAPAKAPAAKSASSDTAAKPAAAPKPVTAPKPATKPAVTVTKPAVADTAKTQQAAPAPKASTPAPAVTTVPVAPVAATTSANAAYVAPAPGKVTTGYKVAGSNWSSGYHTGIDFPVATGTSLKAVAAGTVVSAGNGGAYGNQVVIKLADGKYAQYAHLSSISVSAGQAVTAGQQIGLSGATGNVTGPHLHFEIRTTPDYGSDIDPVAYLAAHGVNV
ncbi:M23 family metallopeptidase [Kitasatospora sp. CB02891]|uniref:M23 family metallopeptidase n=1 Tax=Kitasatospora sp. CB02891 TaxID=2020329 RepID=UPI000C275970|nr:M23 family metallopeptidase [Kitasatospora sp. CB02891]PJN26752.1 peptidase [Kitasatospora sp. CB02891]